MISPRPLRRILGFTAPWLPLAILAMGCRSNSIGSQKPLRQGEIPAAIERARTLPLETAEDKALAKVVGQMIRATKSPLDTSQRVVVRQLLERSAEELGRRSNRPGDLEDLSQAELPARIAVPAGLRAARLLFEDGERSDAFGLIRRLDQRYPSHALRNEAGSLLYEIGTSYRLDKRRKFFLFAYSVQAPSVLEYLSAEYPTHEKVDDALVDLANIYEQDRMFDIAIDKHLELVLWASDSIYRKASEAAIPRLRLADLDGPEYARDELELALEELELWIERYGQHELRSQVDRTLVDCLQRLADNDLVVAKFYARVSNPAGARQHGARGLDFARRARNEEQEAEILAFLESVDEIERVDAPRVLPADIDAPDAFTPGGTGTTTPGDLAPASRVDAERRELDR